MAEPTGSSIRPTDPVGRLLFHIARAFAIIGGLLVCAMAVLTTASVTGRFFLGAAIPGDYEMVAVLCGTAVFAFLPYCQLMGGNVLVDFFMVRAPARVRSFCDVLGQIAYLALGTVLTWRLVYGTIDMYQYGEKTTVVGFPRWTTFPFDVACMVVLLAVTAYTLVRSIGEFKSGKPFVQQQQTLVD